MITSKNTYSTKSILPVNNNMQIRKTDRLLKWQKQINEVKRGSDNCADKQSDSFLEKRRRHTVQKRN